MGGRGSSSGVSGGGGMKWSAKESQALRNMMKIATKFTAKQLDSMSRKQLEDFAAVVYMKKFTKQLGISPEEAYRRFWLLADGNTTAQLKKFIKKNG